MSDDLRELYQEVILEHNRNPRNFGELATSNHEARGHNPLCGDQVTIYLDIEGDVIQDIHFDGQGCAISRASASLMTAALKGKSIQEAEKEFDAFRAMITAESEFSSEQVEELGKLAVFSGIRGYPSRVKCAGLPWHTLMAAIHESKEKVSTE